MAKPALHPKKDGIDLYRRLAVTLAEQTSDPAADSRLRSRSDDPDPLTTLTRTVETSDEDRVAALLSCFAP